MYSQINSFAAQRSCLHAQIGQLDCATAKNYEAFVNWFISNYEGFVKPFRINYEIFGIWVHPTQTSDGLT
ncbi:MAG: hypothetical protein CVV27_00050 [Candidatus Melainabacteria bacterium HGW-Melainabacteria-1]|nr:MAG: hypothetical protein CVV27_00050 [Candidatus Melainabacteria bacterium HGW-Melainabacteria-1]